MYVSSSCAVLGLFRVRGVWGADGGGGTAVAVAPRNRFLHCGSPGGGFSGRLLRHVQRSVAAAPRAWTALPKVQYSVFWRGAVCRGELRRSPRGSYQSIVH